MMMTTGTKMYIMGLLLDMVQACMQTTIVVYYDTGALPFLISCREDTSLVKLKKTTEDKLISRLILHDHQVKLH